MSSHEPSDPIVDALRLLPGVSPHTEATARVRRRCHAALALRAARQTRDKRSTEWRAHPLEAAWLLPVGLYLLIAVVEVVKVASSLD